MARDTIPIKRAINETEESNQSDVYTLLGNWNAALDDALEESGERFRTQFRKHIEAAVELVDAAALDGEPDWPFLQQCADAYPAGIGDHHCTAIIANVLCRCLVRARVRHGVDAIPVWALEYLGRITIEDNGENARDEAATFGWGIGHDDVAVADRTLARAEEDEEYWASSVVEHAAFADAPAAIDLLERILESDETIEDIYYLPGLQRVLNNSFPRVPQYWEPGAELDYEGGLTEEETEHLLRVLGEYVAPKRLERFDGRFEFDLELAANEYGGEDAV